MVGITALVVCLGPNVLNGLTVIIGRLNDSKNSQQFIRAILKQDTEIVLQEDGSH